ncbi:DUF1419 domain-containing protein (plasmid) [Roseobacter denitrificans]|uniref:Uncharacterized protein n=1 Tax=Roseobacter denitrificans (strain ATCC 33942 / OCh 114) TaxID=375451 RepID=Q07GM9_ROSDO|nr:DUF1419 domain-containing protein [Roseobacter denitrificans]ABI93370.1 hypothetical protein RD1_A0071 [Roseobacter denitrificans OCh 114]AVL51259.1 DUF1419 domain-containing protein [Roseobacter denitrificans]SFG47257.1 Protein of unknown function [Roseobacter denitrificans OCh 114]
MALKFTSIHEGVADRAKSFDLINRGYGPDQRFAGQWFETTEDVYTYFLEVLPPLDWTADGFSMSEFATGFLTDAYLRINGRFFCLCIHRERAMDFTNTLRAFKATAPANAA